NHTNVLGAAMFQTTYGNDTHQSVLSSDDVAFVSSLYPAPGGDGYATVNGKATLSDGSPVRGGMITVLDPATGITVGGFASLTDGSFKLRAPPGNYLVYVEPLSGYVLPGNLYIPANLPVDTNFQSSFLGGNDTPSLLNLTAGASLTVNLEAMPGGASFQAPFLGVGMAGGSNETLSFHQGPLSIASGQAVDLLISGPGIEPLGESNLQILGPGITIRSGTLRKDGSTLNGLPVYRVTVDIAAAAASTLGTVILRKGSNIATLTGVIAVGKPQTVNAGSFLGGAVSPGEVVSFCGPRAGSSTPVYGGLDAT